MNVNCPFGKIYYIHILQKHLKMQMIFKGDTSTSKRLVGLQFVLSNLVGLVV